MIRPILFLCLLGLVAQPAAAGPRVVADIPPLAALVAMVAGPEAEVTSLLDAQADPHHAALRPSQMRAIASADLAVTFGDALAPGLARALRSQGPAAQVVLEGGEDHAWLDPATAARWLNPIAAALAAIDRDHAAAHARRAIAARARLIALRDRLRNRLAGLDLPGLASGHEAYGAFARAAGIGPVLALADHEDAPPGAARMAAFMQALDSGAVGCILAADEHEAEALAALADGRARVVVADMLGRGLPPGAALYEALIDRLAEAVAGCAEPRP